MRIEPAERKILELLDEAGEAAPGRRTSRGPGSPTVDADTARAMAQRGLISGIPYPSPTFRLADLGRAVLAGSVERVEGALADEARLSVELDEARRRRNEAVRDAAAEGLPLARIAEVADVSPERARQWAADAERRETRR